MYNGLSKLNQIQRKFLKGILTKEEFASLNDCVSNGQASIDQIEQMYPVDMINNSVVLPIGNKRFLFSKGDYRKINEHYLEILQVLASRDDLDNPVFVEVQEDGILCID